MVAPFAGAWIEIGIMLAIISYLLVAPFAGAWIEILLCGALLLSYKGRSLRGSVD